MFRNVNHVKIKVRGPFAMAYEGLNLYLILITLLGYSILYSSMLKIEYS